MSALSTPSSSISSCSNSSATGNLHPKVETRKQSTKQDKTGTQERINKEEREKEKFNQMTKSQTKAEIGHLS